MCCAATTPPLRTLQEILVSIWKTSRCIAVLRVDGLNSLFFPLPCFDPMSLKTTAPADVRVNVTPSVHKTQTRCARTNASGTSLACPQAISAGHTMPQQPVVAAGARKLRARRQDMRPVGRSAVQHSAAVSAGCARTAATDRTCTDCNNLLKEHAECVSSFVPVAGGLLRAEQTCRCDLHTLLRELRPAGAACAACACLRSVEFVCQDSHDSRNSIRCCAQR